MKQLYIWGMLSICLSFSTLSFAQTMLSPGDIVVLSLQADNPDAFSFVTLVDLDAGTELFFTDSGWQSSGSFRANEGALKYTAPPGGLSAGTLIGFINGTLETNFTDANDGNVGNNGFNLSASGDQILVFQDSDFGNAIPASAEPKFIFALQSNSTQWQVGSNDSNQSDLPTGLVDGQTALALGANSGPEDEFDNTIFDLSAPYASRANFETDYRNPMNWFGSNANTDLTYLTLGATQATFRDASIFLSGALPVELVSFEGKRIESGVKITWATAAETNNEYFEVQRSTDGKTFEAIAQIKGAGNSEVFLTYDVMDDAPKTGVNYYMLKQVDFDGSFEYSPIISVHVNKSEEEKVDFSVYPTQVRDELNLAFDTDLNEQIDYQIFNLAGQVVQTGTLNTKIDTPTIGTRSWQTGAYFFQIKYGNQISTKRFTKVQ